MSSRSGIYIVPIHRWYIERSAWLVAGLMLLGATGLAVLHHPLWALAVVAIGMVWIGVARTGFIGAAMVWFATTGFCIMPNGLCWVGAEPRLAPMSVPPHSQGV